MDTIDKSEFEEWKVKDNYYYSQTKKLVDLYNKKDFQTIIVNAKELLKKYQNQYLLINLIAASYSELEKYNESTNYFEKLFKLYPKAHHALFNLAQVYEKQNRLELAIDFYNKSITLKSNFEDAYNNLGQIQA